MEGIVNFISDQIGWYHSYNDDAIVISNIIGYKLYERYNGINAIGFPCEYLSKVTKILSQYDIGYCLDDELIVQYPNSKYNECLNSDNFPKLHVYPSLIKHIKREVVTGEFIIQFNDEEPITREIGVNINENAKIIEFLIDKEVGKSYVYGDDIIKIINKNLKREEYVERY